MSPTLRELNASNNPVELGGRNLGKDAYGNELWLFGEKVANRFVDTATGECSWDADVAGWGYTAEDSIEG